MWCRLLSNPDIWEWLDLDGRVYYRYFCADGSSELLDLDGKVWYRFPPVGSWDDANRIAHSVSPEGNGDEWRRSNGDVLRRVRSNSYTWHYTGSDGIEKQIDPNDTEEILSLFGPLPLE